MYVENIQGYASTNMNELATLITKYITSGDIKVITRVEVFTTTDADDSIRFYNGDKIISEFANMAGSGNYKVSLYGNLTDAWVSSNSTSINRTRYIYRMIVCKHGVLFKTAGSSGSTSLAGIILFTETKNSETGCFVRYASGSNMIYTGYFVAWNDQNPYSSVNIDSDSHQSFTGLMSIPTNSATGNYSVNTYYMPFTQFKTYEGIITLNGEKYYTDGAIVIKDE